MKENLKIKMKGSKGITLIALIVTIIVLIILAGISINLLLGENGLLQRAKDSKTVYDKSTLAEKMSLMMLDYRIQKDTTGITLEDYLTKNNIEYELDGENIKIEEDGYVVTINPITLEMDEPVKTTKTAKIGLSARSINPNEGLTVTLTFGEDVDVVNCKYKFARSDVDVTKDSMSTATSVTGTSITIPNTETTQKGEYYFYLLVAYKDTNETLLKKTKVTVGVSVTSVTLNKTNLNLFVGDNEPLGATVQPSNAIQGISYSTNNSDIATVDNSGVVTAVSAGTATITATSTDDTSKTATCTVVVETLESIAIMTEPTKTEYDQGENFDTSGMVVTATYASGNTRNVTSSVTATPAIFTTAGDDITVTISYTEGSITKTATTTVTVVPVYTWEKYSAKSETTYRYRKLDETTTKRGAGDSYYAQFSSLDGSFDSSNGLWTPYGCTQFGWARFWNACWTNNLH